jgi:hypothetical protein
MNPLSLQLKLALAAGLIATTSFATWYATSDHYQKQIAEIQLGMSTAVQTQLLADQQALVDEVVKRKTAEENHAKDQLIVNSLRNNIERLQLNKICSSALQESRAASEDPDRATGLLSAAAEAAFTELQRGIDEDLARCDQLNIDARKINASQ